MVTKGYGSYRGRSGFRTFLKVLIAILLILLIFLVGAFFLLEPYVVYSADGIRVDLSRLLERETGPEPEPPEDPAPLVVDMSTPEPAPTPEPTPEPVELFHGILLPGTALYDGTAKNRLEAAGASAAIFNMKDDSGTLGYISSLELAVQAKVSDSNPAINAAIQLLNEEELYTVAWVSCFRDNTIPRTNMDITVPSSVGNWRDADSYRWLSPANPDARAYVTGVCVELAALGFDELLLDNCGFPTRGQMSYIKTGANYDPNGLELAVEAFLQELKQALADYPDVKISIMTSETVLTGAAGNISGQSMALLTEYAGRIWAAPPSTLEISFTQILRDAGMDASQLVTVVSEPSSEEENWAILN